MTRQNERIGAVLGGNSDEVHVFGYGVYEGDFVPGPEATGWLADALRENNIANPRLRLDNGEVIYGCECWWGSEESVKNQMAEWEAAGVKIVFVTRADMFHDPEAPDDE